MSRPALALIALLLVAFGIIALTSGKHHPDRLPSEQQALDDQASADAKAKEAQAQQEKATAITNDPKRLTSFDAVKTGAVRARLEIEGHPPMTLEMYPQAAPKTVAHITDLIKKHFYDGILVHRVVPGFVFQTGDPASKKYKPDDLRGLSSEEVSQKFGLGNGGSGTTVPLEAKLPHLKYSLGLARSNSEDSGDSQFYINLNDNGAQLDGKYCAFGRVIEGQATADDIKIGDRIKSLTLIP